MNNKVVLKIVAICAGLLLVFGVLAAVLAVVTLPKNFDEENLISFGNKESFEYHENEVLDLDGISKISISTVSTDVIFYQSDEDLEVTLDVQGYSRGESVTLVAETDGNTAKVEIKYPKINFRDWNNLNITKSLMKIGIPADYSESIYINGVSCDIEITDSIANSFAKLDAHTVSGTVRISCSSIDFLNLASTSGDLIVDDTLIDILSVDTTSGSIYVGNINSENGSIDINSISGDVRIYYNALCKTKINTISGEVELIVPADSSMNLDFDSTSGDLSGNYSTHSDGVDVQVDTTSGDLHIKNN